MKELWAERGFDGVRAMLDASTAGHLIGRHAAQCITGTEPRVNFIWRCFSLTGDLQTKANLCVQGMLHTVREESGTGLLEAAAKDIDADQRARLFTCAPF